MQPIARFVIGVVLLGSIFWIAYSCFTSNNSTSSRKDNPVTGQADHKVASQAPAAPVKAKAMGRKAQLALSIQQRLIDARWDKEAAEAVVKLNIDWFDILNQGEDRVFLDRQLAGLQALEDTHAELLKRHPETAGLLAAVDEADRALVAHSLTQDPTAYKLVAGLYIRHAAPEDAVAMAQALHIHHGLICELVRRGLLGAEVLFIFPRSGKMRPAAREYDRWLKEVLEVKLSGTHRELASMINLLLGHGEQLRRRLQDDEKFLRAFRDRLWPQLCDVVKEQGNLFDPYLDEPGVWDVLARNDGKELLTKWGLLAVNLLHGNQGAYPLRLHEYVARLLLEGDDHTVQGLVEFRDEKLFHDLLKRELSVPRMAWLAKKLLAAKGDHLELLRQFVTENDFGALTEELDPPQGGLKSWLPLYDACSLAGKVIRGRRVKALEVLGGLAGTALDVVPVLKGGKFRPGSSVGNNTASESDGPRCLASVDRGC